jgi:uncharacterized repeat protein (TIGR01451 family)
LRNLGNVEIRNITVNRIFPDSGLTLRVLSSLEPGTSVSFSGEYPVPILDSCRPFVRVIATGTEACGGQLLTATEPVNCTVTTTPQLTVTLAGPLSPPSPGQEVVFSGTLRNSGDATLKQVVVSDPRVPEGGTVLFSRERLDPGESALFALRLPSSVDACSVKAQADASAVDACSGMAVSDADALDVSLAVVGGLEISQTCLSDIDAFDGTSGYGAVLRNSGNVALTGISVLESQVGGWSGRGTELWFDESLPAGVQAEATGGDSWASAPVSSPRLSGYSAWQSGLAEGFHQLFFTGDTRGFAVAEGEVLVAHVFLDPEHPPREVMLQWYDGSWEHRAYWGENLNPFGIDGTAALRPMGELPKSGQWVRLEVPAHLVGLEGKVLRGMALSLHGGRATWDALGKRPGGEEPPVFTVARLEPGQSVSFRRTGLRPPDGACAVTTLLSAEATLSCSVETIRAFTTGTCNLPTRAGLEVMQMEPLSNPVPGGALTFRGIVRNSGPVALTRVVVTHQRTGAAPLLEIPTLLPGESRELSGSFPVPTNACRISGTVAASATDACSGERVFDSMTSIHTIAANPQISVAKNCPAGIPVAGQRLEYEGVVINTGDITLVDVYVRASRSGDAPLLGPLVLAPGESATFFDAFVPEVGDCGVDRVTASGLSLCEQVVTAGMSTRCAHLPVKPAIQVTQGCPLDPPLYGAPYRALGTVKNTGNVALVDVRITHNAPAEGTPVLGPITLQPGESVEYAVTGMAPLESCELVDTVTVSASDRCDGIRVSDTATTVCPLQSFPRLSVAKVCPSSPVSDGQPWMFAGSVTNTGNVLLTNVQVFQSRWGGVRLRVFGPMNLAPGEVAHFVATAPEANGSDPSLDVLEAVGEDGCRGTHVSVRANCRGVIPYSTPVLKNLVHNEGGTTVTWSSEPGAVYVVEYADALPAQAWNALPGRVNAIGDTATVMDTSAKDTRRFYRVVIAE